jgi:DNA-binding NtrC family response regulator
MSQHEFLYIEEDAPDVPHEAPASLPVGATVADIERELVLQTLARCNGNRTHAARQLGVSVRTLRNRIRLYSARGINVPAHG